MSAVSCETFAIALFGCIETKSFEPIQLEIIKSMKNNISQADRDRYSEKFDEFLKAIRDQICQVEEGTHLTLEYFVRHRYGKETIKKIRDDYKKFLNAAERNDINKCKRLIKDGLAPTYYRPIEN